MSLTSARVWGQESHGYKLPTVSHRQYILPRQGDISKEKENFLHLCVVWTGWAECVHRDQRSLVSCQTHMQCHRSADLQTDLEWL